MVFFSWSYYVDTLSVIVFVGRIITWSFEFWVFCVTFTLRAVPFTLERELRYFGWLASMEVERCMPCET